MPLYRVPSCPGFGQDRVNFHQEPGGNTAGRADPTWSNRAGCSIPCAVMLGSGGGELGGGNSLAARKCTPVAGGESCSVGSAILFCVFSLSVSLLFAALLNCPYPDPPVSACFFPFSSEPQRGEGQPRGAFVAGHSQTITLLQSKSFVFHGRRQSASPSLFYFIFLEEKMVSVALALALDHLHKKRQITKIG